MTGAVVGGLVCGVGAAAAVLVVDRVRRLRWTSVEARVLPFLRDLRPAGTAGPVARGVRPEPADGVLGLRGTAGVLLAPALDRVAGLIGRVLGGGSSIRARLERAGSGLSLHEFRIEQVLWGLVAFLAAAVPSGLLALASPARSGGLMVACLAAFVLGVLVRENRLTSAVALRERRVLQELPSIAELLALAVAAGESPVAALDRVAGRSRGAFSVELQRVLAESRTGVPVAEAFDRLAARSGLGAVARFAEAISISIERGTPLADVLHAQAGDVREAARRALIEAGARKEVLMMVPIVFLVLPVVVTFAFWPGVVGLRLVVP